MSGLISAAISRQRRLYASPDGAANMGFRATGTDPAIRTMQDKAREKISLLDFNGADRNGNNDNCSLIRRAVAEAVAAGVNQIDTPGVFRSDGDIVLPPGVWLDGGIAPGYYAGMKWFEQENTKRGPRGRIIAGAPIVGGLIKFDTTSNSDFGFGLRNIIVDANKFALNAVSMVGGGVPYALTERPTRLRDVLLQGSTGDGAALENVLSQWWDNVVIAACDGFGMRFAYGVSDSSFRNLNIHGCSKGALQIGDGSSSLFFTGGKWEDNYGPCLDVYSQLAGVDIKLNGVSLNTNNGSAIKNNGGSIFASDCRIFNHPYEGTAAIEQSAGMVQWNGGSIGANGCNFIVSGGTVTIDSGTNISPASRVNKVISGPGRLFIRADRDDTGAPVLRNGGAMQAAVDIAPSSSAQVRFVGALAGGMGSTYHAMKNFALTVMHAQFPQAPDPAHTFIGLVITGKSGGAANAAIKVIAAHTVAGLMGGIYAEVDGNDILVKVETGANWGAISGHQRAYITLGDQGLNQQYL